MADKAEVKAHKAEGSLTTVPVLAINNNPYRADDVFLWMENKLKGLIETYKVDGFQSTVEVTTDKWDKFYLAGGGHHRTEALRRIVRGEIDGVKPEDIRGLFQNSDGEWCVKIVKKKYTREQMMRNFMIENATMWGQDEKQNIYMMIANVRNHLNKVLSESADVDAFKEAIVTPYELQMDERAFSRLKNSDTGAGASLISQYVGENTWGRSTISAGIQILDATGPEGDALRELAEKLPSVVLAYKFKKLMVTTQDGDKVLSSEDDQKKASKIIERESLTRADLEAADKLKTDEDLSPLAALNQIVDLKKGEKKAAKGEEPTGASAPSKAKAKPAEEAMASLKSVRGWIKLMKSENDKWSKAQMSQAKSMLKEIAEDIAEMSSNKKKK